MQMDGERAEVRLKEMLTEGRQLFVHSKSQVLPVRPERNPGSGSKCVSRNKEKRKHGKLVVTQEEEATTVGLDEEGGEEEATRERRAVGIHTLLFAHDSLQLAEVCLAKMTR